MKRACLVLLLSSACVRVDQFHSATLPVAGVEAAQVDLQRGDLYWSGVPQLPVLDTSVRSWAVGSGEGGADRNEARNDWGVLVESGLARVWGASGSGRAGVDWTIQAPSDLPVDAILLEGVAFIDGTSEQVTATAWGVALIAHSGSADVFATSGGIDAVLFPEPGSHVVMGAASGDVFLGLPAGLDIDIEVVGDPRYGMELADLGFDIYQATPGYFSARKGTGEVSLRVTVDAGFFLLYEVETP